MSLTLTITNQPATEPGQELSKTFYQGGTIGRANTNDWILHDKSRYISSKHASIESVNGLYQITDMSTNGVYLNDSNTPIGKGGIAILNDGDRLQIGEIEIDVKVGSAAFDSAPMSNPVQANNAPPLSNSPPVSMESDGPVDPLAFFGSGQSPQQQPANPEMPVNYPMDADLGDPPIGSIPGDASLDPLAAFGQSPKPGTGNEDFGIFNNQDDYPSPGGGHGASSGIDHASPLNTHFEPPNIIPSDFNYAGNQPESNAQNAQANFIPENAMDFMGGNDQVPADVNNNVAGAVMQKPVNVSRPAATRPPSGPAAPPQKAPARPQSPSRPVGNDVALQAFFRGLGLSETNVSARDSAAFMESVGRMIRETIDGTMAILRARSNIKSGFRLSMTTIRAKENNPLKFSISVDDAIRNMFSSKSNSYLRPLAAIQEGFQDIENHQLAVMAGMQAALKAVIENFDPDALEFKCNKGNAGKILTGSKKAKCWDAYRNHYQQISQSLDDQFQQMFGDAFAKAYEEQIAKLNMLKK